MAPRLRSHLEIRGAGHSVTHTVGAGEEISLRFLLKGTASTTTGDFESDPEKGVCRATGAGHGKIANQRP